MHLTAHQFRHTLTKPDLLQRIRQRSTESRLPARSTDNSWQSRLNAGQIRIRELPSENDKLRRQLAAAQGSTPDRPGHLSYVIYAVLVANMQFRIG